MTDAGDEILDRARKWKRERERQERDDYERIIDWARAKMKKIREGKA